MTLRESMQLYCKQHEDCCTCALACVCTNFQHSNIYELGDDEFQAFMYEVKAEISRLQFYIGIPAVDVLSKMSWSAEPVMALYGSEKPNQQESSE